MKIDHVHFYSRNAARTRNWFIHNVGFKAIGNYIGQHTHTELIALNSACFLISSPLNSASPVAKYLLHHPEGVVDIAFRVESLVATIEKCRCLGINVLQDIQPGRSSQGSFKFAQIAGWQDLHHTLIEVAGHQDYCLLVPIEPHQVEPSFPSQIEPNLIDIDHVVLNVPCGKLNSAVELYQKIFDFKVQQSFDIKTSTSGLTSQALIDPVGKVQFNINEPTAANSQIQEFIDFNRGSGIQHLALRSQNLIADVAQMQGLNFLDIPLAYYHNHQALLNLDLTERNAVKQHQILVDRDRNSPQSLLMQIFTLPIFEQPTFFLELIERRHSARGFGQGNFKALFEAVERQSKYRPSIHDGDTKTVQY